MHKEQTEAQVTCRWSSTFQTQEVEEKSQRDRDLGSMEQDVLGDLQTGSCQSCAGEESHGKRQAVARLCIFHLQPEHLFNEEKRGRGEDTRWTPRAERLR